jgi:hypothetical protein
MSAINFGSTISLQEFAHAVATVGNKVTLIGRGEMGIGKSSMLKVIAKTLPTHVPAYIDCTLLDLGDFALPFTVEENGIKVTRFAPNARFRFHEGKPVIIMLDEIGKAMKAVKNVLLTLMLEHRIGDHHLPEGSIVFGTSNLLTEGLGDILEAHARNRVCEVVIRKPHAGFNADGSVDPDSWAAWALDNGIAPEVIAWVKQYPHCLASGTDPSQKDNPYINHPGVSGQGACVTPRTLEKSSHIAQQRAVLGDALTISMLAGTIGESAARDMQAFFTVVDKLATWESIIASPTTAKLPADAVAKCIAVFGAVTRIERDTLGKWMTYVQRMDKEWQALFAKSVMRGNKQSICVTNKEFKDWALANEWLF